jgi:hypothetical protein
MPDEVAPSSRPAFACSRKRVARTSASATLARSSARSLVPTRGGHRLLSFFDPVRGSNTDVGCGPVTSRRWRAKRVVEDMLERVRGAIERRLTDLRAPMPSSTLSSVCNEASPTAARSGSTTTGCCPCARLTAAARQSVDRERRRCRQDRRSRACCARARRQRVAALVEGQPSSAAAQAFVDGSTTEQIDDLGLENEPAEEAIEADEDATAEAATRSPLLKRPALTYAESWLRSTQCRSEEGAAAQPDLHRCRP